MLAHHIDLGWVHDCFHACRNVPVSHVRKKEGEDCVGWPQISIQCQNRVFEDVTFQCRGTFAPLPVCQHPPTSTSEIV